MVGKRQKSSNELAVKKESTKRYFSSPVLSAAEITRKAEEDKRNFEEFTMLLNGEQKREVEPKKSPKPRNLMNNLNENLNDSIVDTSKPLMPNVTIPRRPSLVDDDSDDFFNEEEMANLEAEAVKTLDSLKRSFTFSTEKSVSTAVSIPNIPPTTSSNDDDDDDDDFDDLVLAIPPDLLSGENLKNEPITQNQGVVPKAPATNNFPSTSANLSKTSDKLSAMIPKKRRTSDINQIANINLVVPAPAQRRATPAEIELNRQEALRRRKMHQEKKLQKR